jgi:hypothetical protein
VGPPLAACRVAVQPLVLAVGADVGVDPGGSEGCVVFPNNTSTTDSAEYLLVPQASTTMPDYRTSFRLTGGVTIMAAPPVAALYQAAPLSPAQQFHNALRLMERDRSFPLPGGVAAQANLAAPLVAGAPPVVGDFRQFKVLSNLLNATQFQMVGARVKSVGQHVAIYVDTLAPPGGLTTPDYDKLRSDFDTLLYAIDTTAFGRESDIDANGIVVVLMSNVINKLVTAADCVSSGYVAGFFFGADLDPRSRTSWNNGEVFYSIVADPSGTVSCPHSVTQVNNVIPVTFIHEFQHMISYNQHVLLRSGFPEDLWLNEGMSHYAEERGGRAYLQAGDSATFCLYARGDLYNFGQYVMSPGTHALVDTSGIGQLPERGAAWAFVRFLVDQFAADTSLAAADAFTRQLDRTSLTGTNNAATVTGQTFATLARRWVLANWASDLSGFGTPATMRYKKWAFRTAYPTMYASCSAALPSTYPLSAPGLAGGSISVSGTMYAGSAGAYVRALQAPGAGGFALLLSDANGGQLQSTVAPRLNVLRIR